MRRVVVTGIGALSPLANTAEETFQQLLLGKSGIGNIEHFDTTHYTTKFAGLVKGFDAQHYMEKKEAKKMDLFIQYGVAAGAQAFNDSGLEITEQNAPRIGVAVGSGIGGLGLIEQNHEKLVKAEGNPRKLSPFFVPRVLMPRSHCLYRLLLQSTLRVHLRYPRHTMPSSRWWLWSRLQTSHLAH